MDDMTMFERLTHEIGDNIYGHVDPVDTPNTWGISEAIALCALKVIYAHIPPGEGGLLPSQLANAIADGEVAMLLPLAKPAEPVSVRHPDITVRSRTESEQNAGETGNKHE